MRHHAILVTSSDDALIERAHAEALRILGQPFPYEAGMGGRVSPFTTLITPLSQEAWEGYRSFVVLPDGSKEYWPPSDWMNSLREQFKDWMRKQLYVDGSTSLKWVEVQYGDEGGYNRILEGNHTATEAFHREHPERAESAERDDKPVSDGHVFGTMMRCPACQKYIEPGTRIVSYSVGPVIEKDGLLMHADCYQRLKKDLPAG